MSHHQVIDPYGAGVHAGPGAVVHLELHTGDLPGASAFYSQLLRWRTEPDRRLARRATTTLALGGALDGGIVACGHARAS